MTAFSIPNPCNENWDNMDSAEQGRFCKACAKTVIDFTTMNDEELRHFFLNKKEEKVCGKIRNDQLYRHRINLPQNIFAVTMPYWKRFLAACLLVFSSSLFSCNTILNNDGTNEQHLTGDTVMVTHSIEPPLLGYTTYQMHNAQPTFPVCSETKGDIEMVILDSPIEATMGVLLK